MSQRDRQILKRTGVCVTVTSNTYDGYRNDGEWGGGLSSDSQQQCLLVVLLIPSTFLTLSIVSITSKSVFVFLQFANVDFGWQHAHGHVLRVLPSRRKDLGVMGDELAALGFMRDNLIGVKRRECRACPDARDLGGR